MLTTFTRVHTDDINTLINDEELVLTLVNQLGFDSSILKQMTQMSTEPNPEELFQTLESRWNGQGQIFSLEDQINLLENIATQSDQLANTPLATLSKSGRAIPITNEGEHIRLLFPTQVEAIHDHLSTLPVENLQAIAEDLIQNLSLNIQHAELVSAPLWQIYEGLRTFFGNATKNEEHILLARHEN